MKWGLFGFSASIKGGVSSPIALKEMAYLDTQAFRLRISSRQKDCWSKLADTALFASYLTQQPIFHKRIVQEYSQEYQTHIPTLLWSTGDISAKIQNEEIDDKDFLEQSQAIKAQADQAEKAFVLKKTNELLRMS